MRPRGRGVPTPVCERGGGKEGARKGGEEGTIDKMHGEEKKK